jgi:aspartate/tyrosine/aromatic aminotransferase
MGGIPNFKGMKWSDTLDGGFSALTGKDPQRRAQAMDIFTLSLGHKEDKLAAKRDTDAANKALADQADQAKALQIQTLQQPKQITPDNFLANKNAQLNKLRLGFASTMSGAGSLALPTNPGGKAKLGL